MYLNKKYYVNDDIKNAIFIDLCKNILQKY